MEHKCPQCTKTYSNKKSLNHHITNCHVDDGCRKCKYCNKIFASKSAKNQHELNCKADKDKLWVPSSEINKEKTAEDRHLHIKTNLSEQSKKILDLFKKWLETGGYSKLLVSYKRKLTGNSINTYTYHLRHYFQFVEVKVLYFFNYYQYFNFKHLEFTYRGKRCVNV